MLITGLWNSAMTTFLWVWGGAEANEGHLKKEYEQARCTLQAEMETDTDPNTFKQKS